MDSRSGRSIVIVASLQAAIVAAGAFSSPKAALAATAIGALAVGRYVAVAGYVRTLIPGSKAAMRLLTGSAWVLGLLALLATVAVVAVRARAALPWAVAAAFAGPLGMSAQAFASGLGALTASRRAAAPSRGRP
jgi:hypothetical protein